MVRCLVPSALMILLGGLTSTHFAAAQLPNVLVILTDDQGWGDLSLHGNLNLSTPNIDSLARDGARFDRFYVCPVCSPTRAEFLTGRYHPRGGVYSTSAGGERLDLDEVTIADVFRRGGYATGAFGKWHNGMQYPYHPNGRGFEEYYGFCSGHWGDYYSPLLEHNGRLVQGEGFCVDDFTDQAIEFMQASIERDRPFFAYLPLNTPHSPMQVPDRFWKKFKDAELELHHREPERENIGHIRCALAMCENIDWNVGRLLAKLDDWKIAENTIVIYFCDNGPNGARWNGDMKGRKGSTDEGGVRSPLLVRWPKEIAGETVVKPIAAAIDLLPTLAGLAGIDVGSTKPLDGKSLVPLLQNPGHQAWPDRHLVSHWRGKVSVRNQRFRLDHQGALFELATDPGQRRDVSVRFPDVTKRLQATAARFRTEVEGYEQDDRPFLLGHSDYRYTQLPARDATSNGGIQRSNRFPNCSFLTRWTRTEEQIAWDVEVGADGEYEVELYYACPAADVGSTIELSCGEARLQAKVTEAHDPPLRGQEHDRVPRVESYIKDFRPMKLGTLGLAKGRHELRLTAVDIPGSQVMDFRLLMFTRLDD